MHNNLFIYHGRFQPPHLGHILVVSSILNKYKDFKVFISIADHEVDDRNPLSFEQRKEVFRQFLSDKYKHRIIYNNHKWEDYDQTLQKILDEASKFGEVNGVLFGPSPDEKTVAFWESKNIDVIKCPKRFLDLRATDIRKNLNSYFKEVEFINKNNISIITNFGCNSNCWYCIWKTHKLRNYVSPTEEEVTDFLTKYQFKDKFSISGGGDCLVDYDDHQDFWKLVFKLANDFDMKVDMHSREKFKNAEFWKKINKLVISSDTLEDCKDYLDWLKQYVQIRITHVVTKDTTVEKIQEYLDYVNKNNFQFTLKQLVGFDDNGMYEYLKNKFPDIYYLDEGDYNIYLMPDGKEYRKFLI